MQNNYNSSKEVEPPDEIAIGEVRHLLVWRYFFLSREREDYTFTFSLFDIDFDISYFGRFSSFIGPAASRTSPTRACGCASSGRYSQSLSLIFCSLKTFPFRPFIDFASDCKDLDFIVPVLSSTQRSQ